MAMAVPRPYACPVCRESFTKWGLCHTHIRNSVPCRDSLGDKVNDMDGLQKLCKAAASEGGPPLEPGIQTQDCGSVANASPSLPGDASGTFGFHGSAVESQPQQVSKVVVKRLQKALRQGSLTQQEYQEVQEKFPELCEHSSAVQNAAIEKFFSPGPGNFRWVSNKGGWLLRCLKFCVRTNSVEAQCDSSSATSVLMGALAFHALLPDVLTQQHWDGFAQLKAQEQDLIINTVRMSIPTNVTGPFADHFLNLCLNEQIIHKRESLPPPRMLRTPPAMEWDNIDGTLYHRLLQQLLFRQRNCEERFFKEFADADPEMQPGDPGSLLYTHKSTEEARQNGSAEVLSLLHAGSASGLVRACARLIAEGLDVNECAGVQMTAPLHIAAAHGEVGVLSMLLDKQADPRIMNGEGYTALYVAVETAARLAQSHRDGSSQPSTHRSLQVKVCSTLILAGAESQRAETLAAESNLNELRNFMRLAKRLRRFKLRGIANEAAITELHKLQCETANFAISVYEKHLLPQVNSESASAEFCSLIASDFIQERDRIQLLGNRLARRLHLGKRAVDALRDLPPDAARYVLENWKIEETVPGIFMIPDYLNVASPRQTKSSPPDLVGVDGDGINQGNGTAPASQNGANATSQMPPDPSKMKGRVRKWDSERGFGFIVQDPRPGEETNKDIFVHRTNVVGSSPANHIDMKEGCRVAYKLGMQDGRPRALEATMVDSNFQPLPIHSGIRPATPAPIISRNDDENSDYDNYEEDDLTCKFIRYMRSPEIQEIVAEKRVDMDLWLQCIGLCKHKNARRDETVWRKEIENRIDVLLEKGTTPLLKKDFDFRVRRFLSEFCVNSNVTHVSELLSLVESAASGKKRDDVRSWPAYLATLLRRSDPKLYEVLADRDRRSRLEDRQKKEEVLGLESALIGDPSSIQPDQIRRSGDEHTPRSSEVASTCSSHSAGSSPRSGEARTPAAPAPAPPPNLPHPSADPGPDTSAMGELMRGRIFQ